MKMKQICGSVLFAMAGISCQAGDARDAGEARAYVTTTATIPSDGTCTHIIATRLSDFAVSEYRGVLSGGSFSVLPGDTRVTATAYPEPCSVEPTQPPWIADEQITTFTGAANTLMLEFHENASVVIDPTFDGTPQLVLRAGSPVRLGRNGEDAAGPGFALDGWDVKRIALPPAAPGETVLFSTQGKGGLPSSPRGLAALPDGSFVVQIGDPGAPLRLFGATGTFLESWPVVYPSTAVRFDTTDGLEAIDATHLVRTGVLNAPINCDASGAGCLQAGLDILELATAVDGSHELHVARQLFLPELPGQPLNLQFPVGITPVGTGFAVVTIPNDGSAQQLTLLDAGGAVVAGPVPVTGDVEGLFVAPDGRLGALDYHGHLTMRDPATLAERPGETAFYPDGIDLSVPFASAWDSATNHFLSLTQEGRLVSFSPSAPPVSDVGIDLSVYVSPSGVAYRGDTGQIGIADGLPPADPVTGARIPTVDFYDASTRTRATTVTLQGVDLPARTRTIAYVPGRQQIVSHYRRPGGVPDAALDGVVYTHRLDGTLAGSFDLAPAGFPRVHSVSYLPASDELAISAADDGGVERLVIVAPDGHPKRSYRLDAVGDVVYLAPITSGPSAGDLGAIENQPSNFFQLSLQ